MQGKKLRIKEDFTPFETVAISDSEGQPIQITDAKSDKALPKKLNVVIEATHTGINRNKVSYSYDKLERSTDSWTANYEKPVLLNHDSWSDPLGRVKSAAFKQSVIDPQKHCIQLTLEITNEAAIERFLDGRYKTFSIGGYTDSAVCSICGKDLMTDGYCGHSRGKKYDGKECYWHLGLMDYDEISVVNTPADVHAQALSVEIVGEQSDGQQAKSTEQDNADETGKVNDSADGVLENIDSLLSHSDPNEGDEGNKGAQDDNQKENPEGTQEDNQKDNQEPTGDEGQQQEDNKVAELEKQVKELQDQVTTLNETIVTKDGIIAAKDSELVTKQQELDSVKNELKVANEEAQGLVKQNVSLAKFSHRVLCEKVAELQIAIGDKKLEEKDELLNEYSTYTSKKLNDMATELTKSEKIVQRAKVTSPVAITDGDETEDKASNNEEAVTLQDYVKTMTNFFVNNRY